jgi:aspartate 1-decarboxylase
MFKSKIHRATVTHADLHYEGSCSIDSLLMEAADIIDSEEVHLWNVTRGTRLTTYAIKAPPGSGVVCANGAAAHLVNAGDLVIIATFAEFDNVAADYAPIVVRVDDQNRIVGTAPETAGPARLRSVS